MDVSARKWLGKVENERWVFRKVDSGSWKLTVGYICSKTRQKFKNAQTRSKTGGIARKWMKAGGFFLTKTRVARLKEVGVVGVR